MDGRHLVVGGAGFVGSNLVSGLLEEDVDQVVVVDNFLSSEPKNLPDDKRIDVIEGSIAEEKILTNISDDFDGVYHLAAYHGNQSSIANPLADHEHSLLTTLKLFEHLKDFERLERLVYASTGCALAPKGESPAKPVTEDGPVPLDLDSPYQISKVAGEMYANHYHRLHGLPVVRARFQNVYGPGEILGAGKWRGTKHTVWRNVVPTFIYRALKGWPLEVHGDGSATRDFVYVGDVVDGLIRMGSAPDVEGEAFNLASGQETSIRALAERINDLTGNDAGIEYQDVRCWDRSIHRVGSTEMAREHLGFETTTPLKQGLERTVEWVRSNWDLIQSRIQHHADRHEVKA